jgi:hypothetical protein
MRHPGGTRGCGIEKNSQGNLGVIVLAVPWWETANALADILRRAGYAATWQRPGRPHGIDGPFAAGIWEGGQLDAREAESLSAFGNRLAVDGAPVVALLDFPRRDRCDRAMRIGAAAVLGKPWNNDDVISTLEHMIQRRGSVQANICPSRAA